MRENKFSLRMAIKIGFAAILNVNELTQLGVDIKHVDTGEDDFNSAVCSSGLKNP